MKVGVFSNDFYPFIGGIGKHILDLLYNNEYLNKMIFSPSDRNNLPNHIKIDFILHKILKNISLSFFFNIFINKLQRCYNLDVINIHCGPGGLFLLKKSNCLIVATCHHTFWQQSHYIKSQWWKRIFIPFEKKTYQLADKIIAVSEDSKDILIKKYKIKLEKITVIPNGVEANKFFPITNIEKIPNSMLYIGRVDKRKGVDFLIKSMLRVVKSNPNSKLFIGGKGKDLNKLKKFVIKNKLENNINFLGFISDDKINEWYNKVQCVIVPSIFEGFGITVIESMAAGTLVIGTNVDGIRTIIKNKINGYLVDYGNVGSLSETINYVLHNNCLDIIKNASKDIEEKYNIDIVRKVTGEFYNNLDISE